MPTHLQDVVCGQAVVAPPLAPRHADGLPIEQRAIEGAQVSHLCVGGGKAAKKGAGKVAHGLVRCGKKRLLCVSLAGHQTVVQRLLAT
jgi:hypothetical protein